MAEPTHEGYYRIKGQKIFISAGDHDGVENVVHLLLAKIEGAPAGVLKGPCDSGDPENDKRR